MRVALLLLGVVAMSTSVIWIKLSAVDPVWLTVLRLVVATVALAPLAVRDWRRHRARLAWSDLREPVLPGLILAAHFVTWILGARLTPAANSGMVVNLAPILLPLLLAPLAGEWLTRRELAATLLAAAGLAVLVVGDLRLSPGHVRGDAICTGSMALFAVYLALGRRYRKSPTVWLYVVPLYATAAVAALLVAPLWADPTPVDWRREWPWVLLLGLVPTVVGHTLLNNAMRHFRGQVVGIVNMGQMASAGLLGYAVLGERPAWTLYPAAALVVLAGAVALGERPDGAGEGG